MGYRLNRLDEPVLIAVSKSLLTEFIPYRLESCVIERSFISTTYIRIYFRYVSTGQETMAMNGGLSGSGVGGAPIDQDKVTTVARDCLLAYVECQVFFCFSF